MKSWQGRATRADEGPHGNLAGAATLRVHELVCPKDIQYCGEKCKDCKTKKPLGSAVGVMWGGVISVTLPVSHFQH